MLCRFAFCAGGCYAGVITNQQPFMEDFMSKDKRTTQNARAIHRDLTATVNALTKGRQHLLNAKSRLSAEESFHQEKVDEALSVLGMVQRSVIAEMHAWDGYATSRAN